MRRTEPVQPGHPAPDRADYLRERTRPGPLVVLLLLAIAYPFAASAAQAGVFVALCVLAALLAARAPRWLCYAALAAVLCVMVSGYVFGVANGAEDAQSERDEAVELAAQALVSGTNPWARRTPLDMPITTGPASVLAALPSVLTTGRINATSFLFYALFFAVLCAADIRQRNESFLPLGLFFLSGFFGFQHALYWSLDELAWAYLALAWGAWLLERGWPMGAGACLAFALCSRVSYAFPVFALLCWDWYRPRAPRHLWGVAAGAALATGLIAAPFLFVAGSDLLAHNPLTVAGRLLGKPWPDTNPVFHALNAVVAAVGPRPAAVVKAALALAAIWYTAARIGRSGPAHPFWHLCFAAVLATFLVYPAGVSDDYILFFAVPAFLAIAWSPSGFGTAAGARAAAATTGPARSLRGGSERGRRTVPGSAPGRRGGS